MCVCVKKETKNALIKSHKQVTTGCVDMHLNPISFDMNIYVKRDHKRSIILQKKNEGEKWGTMALQQR